MAVISNRINSKRLSAVDGNPLIMFPGFHQNPPGVLGDILLTDKRREALWLHRTGAVLHKTDSCSASTSCFANFRRKSAALQPLPVFLFFIKISALFHVYPRLPVGLLSIKADKSERSRQEAHRDPPFGPVLSKPSPSSYLPVLSAARCSPRCSPAPCRAARGHSSSSARCSW